MCYLHTSDIHRIGHWSSGTYLLVDVHSAFYSDHVVDVRITIICSTSIHFKTKAGLQRVVQLWVMLIFCWNAVVVLLRVYLWQSRHSGASNVTLSRRRHAVVKIHDWPLIVLFLSKDWQQLFVIFLFDTEALGYDVVQLSFIYLVVRTDIAVKNDNVCVMADAQFRERLLYLADFQNDRHVFAGWVQDKHFDSRVYISSDLCEVVFELKMSQVL